MTALHLSDSDPEMEGLRKSVNLMRSLGPQADAVWEKLDPADASRLRQAMAPRADERVGTSAGGSSEQSLRHSDVWQRLASLQGDKLANLLSRESPQLLALVLSRLPAAPAAELVRRLPLPVASTALHRLASLGPVSSSAFARLECVLEMLLDQSGQLEHGDGVDQVAEILDQIPGKREQALLRQLDEAEHGLLSKLQDRMFRFPDLARLDSASTQTLLAHCDRDVLVAAMTGPDAGPVLDHLTRNMTQRAAALLKTEIDASPHPDKGDISAARLTLIRLARSLARSGDILIAAERRKAGAR